MKRNQSKFKLAKIAICSLFLAFSSPLLAQDIDTGWEAYQRGDYEEALTIFLPLAEQSVAGAQTLVGNIYRGVGGAEVQEFINYDQAAKWYRKATEQGNGPGQVQLAFMYVDGKGLKRDFVQYYKWLMIAEQHGTDISNTRNITDRLLENGLLYDSLIQEAEKLAREWKPSSRSTD